MDALNLRKKVVGRFGEDRNAQFSAILQKMDACESWTLDENPDVLKAIDGMVKVLNDQNVSEDTIKEELENFMLVMAYMQSSKSLRLVAWFDEKYKGKLSEYIIKYSIDHISDPYSSLFYERLSIVKQLRLMKEIYSPDRIEKVKKLLNKMKESGRLD